MTLPEFSIKRHVFTLMVSMVLVLFGIIGFSRLGLDRFPKIDFPAVTITTTMRGADPDIIDKNITDVIEEACSQVPGVKSITSNSALGASVVAVEFDLDKNLDVAYQEVKAKVDAVVKRLPDDSDPPVVRKVEVGASAVIWLALQGDRTVQQLNTYAEEVIKPRLETISGVGDEAYLHNNANRYAELYVRAGKHLLTLQANMDGKIESVKPGVLNLAKALAPKLR